VHVTEEELEAILEAGEAERSERKASLAEPDRLCEAICAFANDLPASGQSGVVFIGVDNKTGNPTGLEITDLLLQQLADLRSNGKIVPFPEMSVTKRRLRDGDVACIVVQPSYSPPVQFRGRTWIRVGSRRAVATPDEERRLVERRRAGDLPFDARALPSATLEDLDLHRFGSELLPQLVAEDVLEANQRGTEQQLSALRFTSPDSRPTAAGILFTGVEPMMQLPGAYVQFVRFDGRELTSPVRSEHQVSGTVPDQIREAEEILRANNDTAVVFEGTPTQEERPRVPFPALEQVVRNAVMHRSYEQTNAPVRVYWFDDRVEISSPGGPYGQVSVEAFGTPGITDYRNPTIAGVLRDLGYVQRFGVGIEVTRRRMQENGNAAPIFEATDANVNVTLPLL